MTDLQDLLRDRYKAQRELEQLWRTRDMQTIKEAIKISITLLSIGAIGFFLTAVFVGV